MSSSSFYLLAFGFSLVLSLLLVPVVRDFATRRGFLDVPGGHKSHSSPVTILGGVAMVVAFTATTLVGTWVREGLGRAGANDSLSFDPTLDLSSNLVREVLIVTGLAVCFAVLGLWDDLRQVSPQTRLIIGFLLSIVLATQVQMVETPLPQMADFLLTLFWIVGITNAFNLLDNIDGLAAGTAAVASSTFFLIAVFNDQGYSALLSIGLAGAMLGFLRSNFHPATIYMGDAGSLFVGFLMAYLGLKMRTNVTEIPQLFAPIVVLGVAVLDTTVVVVSRLRRGVSPFNGGQDHLSHRLRRLGLSVRRSVTTLLLASAALGGLSVALSDAPAAVGYWLLGAVVLLGIMSLVLLTTKVTRTAAPEAPDISPQ